MFGKSIDVSDIPASTVDRMRKKGMSCDMHTYRVVCAAYNKRNELLGITTNTFRRDNVPRKRFAGYHCEMKALHRWGSSLKTIVLMRLGHSGDILPIDCCPKCEAVLKKCGIRVLKIKGN